MAWHCAVGRWGVAIAICSNALKASKLARLRRRLFGNARHSKESFFKSNCPALIPVLSYQRDNFCQSSFDIFSYEAQ